MVVFKAHEESTGQFLEVHFGPIDELWIDVKDFEGNFQSIILNHEQIEELSLFLQKKIK